MAAEAVAVAAAEVAVGAEVVAAEAVAVAARGGSGKPVFAGETTRA